MFPSQTAMIMSRIADQAAEPRVRTRRRLHLHT
jgi:hypothetical protein